MQHSPIVQRAPPHVVVSGLAINTWGEMQPVNPMHVGAAKRVEKMIGQKAKFNCAPSRNALAMLETLLIEAWNVFVDHQKKRMKKIQKCRPPA